VDIQHLQMIWSGQGVPLARVVSCAVHAAVSFQEGVMRFKRNQRLALSDGGHMAEAPRLPVG